MSYVPPSQDVQKEDDYTLGVKILAVLVVLGSLTGIPVLVTALVIIYIRMVELLWQVTH